MKKRRFAARGILSLAILCSLFGSQVSAQTKVNPQQINSPSTCKNLANVRCVDTANSAKWSGSTTGDWISSAIANCPKSLSNGAASGCHVMLAAGSYTITSGHEIVLTNGSASSPVYLTCDPGSDYFSATVTNGTTVLNYTGAETAITLNASFGKSGLDGCTIVGPGSGTSAVCVAIGGTNGAVMNEVTRNDISQCGTGLQINDNVYVTAVDKNNIHDNGKYDVYIPANEHTGENIHFSDNALSNKGSSFNTKCVYVQAHTDIDWFHNSFDQCGITYDGTNIFANHTNNHVENPNGATASPFMTLGNSSCASGCANHIVLNINDKEWLEDGTSGVRADFIEDDVQTTNHQVVVNIFGGTFVPNETVGQLVKGAGAGCCLSGITTNWVNGFGGSTFTAAWGGNVFGALDFSSGQISGSGNAHNSRIFASFSSNLSLTGFGTSPSLSQQNGTLVFEVTVGSGGSATTGTVTGFPIANAGWGCTVTDETSNIVTRVTSYTTSSLSVTAASAWGAGDKLLFTGCGGF